MHTGYLLITMAIEFLAVEELPVQCSDPCSHLHSELVTGKLAPPTPADCTKNERIHVQEETDQSGPSALVLSRPPYTYSPQQETGQSDHSLLRMIAHGSVIHIIPVYTPHH